MKAAAECKRGKPHTAAKPFRENKGDSAVNHQLNILRQMSRHLRDHVTLKQLGKRGAMWSAKHEHFDAEGRREVDDCCGRIVAHGIERNDRNVRRAPQFQHARHDFRCLAVILPAGAFRA